MKFLEFPHPEGGRMIVHVDHITSAIYRQGEASTKARLSLDLDERLNEVVIFGDDADQAWEELQKLKSES